MNVNFVYRMEMNRRSFLSIYKKMKYFLIPTTRKNTVGLFIPNNEVYIDIESIYRYHSHDEQSFIKKLTQHVLPHEGLHCGISNVNKTLTCAQEHWAIERLGY